jgi:MSHA biogenesis protein MshK
VCDRLKSAYRVRKFGCFLVFMTIVWHAYANAEVLIDPTQPPGLPMSGKHAGIKSAPRWLLTSTLIAPARRLATINGKIVSVGERVGDARVMTIEPARVLLREGKKDIVVELSPRDFKRMR